MEIGQIIIKLRKHRRLTQTELAKKIGISVKHMNELERGVKYPRWEMLIQILEALDATFHVKAKVLTEIELSVIKKS